MKTLLIAVGALMLLSASLLSTPALAQKEVVVINGPAEPLPVEVQSPVSVGNSSASPVPVRDVDQVGANLYQSSALVTFTGNSFGQPANFAPIPPNSVLIIEHLSILAALPSDQNVHVSLGVGNISGVQFRHIFSPTLRFPAGGSGSIDIQILSQELNLASTGAPSAQVGRTAAASGDGTVEINISGRLVPVAP